MKKFTILFFCFSLLVIGLSAQKAPIVGVVDVQQVLLTTLNFNQLLKKSEAL